MARQSKGPRHVVSVRVPMNLLPDLDETRTKQGFDSRGDLLLHALKVYMNEGTAAEEHVVQGSLPLDRKAKMTA